MHAEQGFVLDTDGEQGDVVPTLHPEHDRCFRARDLQVS